VAAPELIARLRGWRRDLGWVALATVATCVLSIVFELHERCVAWVAHFERWTPYRACERGERPSSIVRNTAAPILRFHALSDSIPCWTPPRTHRSRASCTTANVPYRAARGRLQR
jgi:hypothetical protein